MTLKLEIELGPDAQRIIALLQVIANLPHIPVRPNPSLEPSARPPKDESAGRLFLGEKDLARLLKVSPAVLHKWRKLGTGPKFVKLSRLVRYRRSDVDEWIATKCGDGSGDDRS